MFFLSYCNYHPSFIIIIMKPSCHALSPIRAFPQHTHTWCMVYLQRAAGAPCFLVLQSIMGVEGLESNSPTWTETRCTTPHLPAFSNSISSCRTTPREKQDLAIWWFREKLGSPETNTTSRLFCGYPFIYMFCPVNVPKATGPPKKKHGRSRSHVCPPAYRISNVVGRRTIWPLRQEL